MIALALFLLAAPAPVRVEAARGSGSASAAGKTPVTFYLRSNAAELEVVAADRISLAVLDQPALQVALFVSGGDRFEAEFGGKRQLHDGKARLELPRGSKLDLSSLSGKITVADGFAEVRVRGMSGRIEIRGGGDIDIETIDGAVQIANASRSVRVHTISGSTSIAASTAALQLEVESSSGGLDFQGACGRGCHLDVDTVGGDVHLSLERQSSLELKFTSHSGAVHDELGLEVRRRPKSADGGWLEASMGAGEGVVEAETFSGTLFLKPR